MLHIFICEDNEIQRTDLEELVCKHIHLEDFDIGLAISTESPAELLKYLEAHPGQGGLYFLDVDLKSSINGIELAAQIKKMDVSATIVFITTHSEMMHYVFRLKIEAMEYIIKGSPSEEIEQRIVECIRVAYQRFLDGKHTANKYFTVQSSGQKFSIRYDEILFFESSIGRRNKITLHTENKTMEFYGTIVEISKLGPPFFSCHQSFVVNVNYVRRIDIPNREAELKDGTIIPITRKKIVEFTKSVQ